MQFLNGPMTQLAWVVDDIEAAEQDLTRHHGLRHWTRLPNIVFGADTCTLRGAPAEFAAHISLSYLGDLQLELIQPVRGESIYTEFLAEHGPGLHHGCWEVDNLAAALENAKGHTVVQAGAMAGGEHLFAYLEPGLSGFAAIELGQIGPGVRSFFDSIKAACDGDAPGS